MSDQSPHARESDLLERIRQLEIERDDYKAYTVATMNEWEIFQDRDGLWYRQQRRCIRVLGPHATWYLAAHAAMKQVRNAAAGKAAEYLEGTKE